jgi:hypothetical protein
VALYLPGLAPIALTDAGISSLSVYNLTGSYLQPECPEWDKALAVAQPASPGFSQVKRFSGNW